jgi:L-seryl-tRNA(Ser) seleniumtransferase
MSIYDELGVRRVINAATTFTAIGGSLMPPEVLEAMREAAGSFVDMHELHDRAGEVLADLTRNEAAYVTPGCAAGIVLAVLACRTRGDLGRIAALPSSRELPDEVVMHTAHRIPYDPAIQLAGATIRNVGNVLQTFDWELDSAITDRTAAVFWVAGTHLPLGALSLTETVRIAHARGVPVIVDAAAQLPPMENLWRFTAAGADLVLFSGGKALRGPQASGMMVGRPELISAARANGSPNQRLARSLKVGKEEIAGLVAAVRRYVTLDHSVLAEQWMQTCTEWSDQLSGVAGASTEIDPWNEAGQPVPRLRVRVDAAISGRDAVAVVEALRLGDPAIAVLPGGSDAFYLGPDLLEPGEWELVATRVKEELGRGAKHGPLTARVTDAAAVFGS